MTSTKEPRRDSPEIKSMLRERAIKNIVKKITEQTDIEWLRQGLPYNPETLSEEILLIPSSQILPLLKRGITIDLNHDDDKWLKSFIRANYLTPDVVLEILDWLMKWQKEEFDKSDASNISNASEEKEYPQISGLSDSSLSTILYNLLDYYQVGGRGFNIQLASKSQIQQLWLKSFQFIDLLKKMRPNIGKWSELGDFEIGRYDNSVRVLNDFINQLFQYQEEEYQPSFTEKIKDLFK